MCWKLVAWALEEFWETYDITVSNPGRYEPSIIYGGSQLFGEVLPCKRDFENSYDRTALE